MTVEFDPTAGHASKPLDTPERCPVCNTSLADVTFADYRCPNCGHELGTQKP